MTADEQRFFELILVELRRNTEQLASVRALLERIAPADVRTPPKPTWMVP